MSQFDNSSEAISCGLRFLATSQLDTGQFPVEVTFHYKGDEQRSDGTVFATAHIVYALGHIPLPGVEPMIERALAYFRRQMNWQGLWHYWNKDAKWDNFKLHPYIPADLDDMASISYLLTKYKVPFPDNRYLFYMNQDRNSRFFTWLVLRFKPTFDLRYWVAVLSDISPLRYTLFWKASEACYGDVDGVVNANVLLYLGLSPKTESTVQWLVEIVRDGKEATCDKWYRDVYTFYYALSRAYYGGVKTLADVRDIVIRRIIEAQQPDGRIGNNPLQTGLAVNALLNYHYNNDDNYRDANVHREALWTEVAQKAVRYLLSNQEAAGVWPAAPYYFGGPKQAVSWGGRELTTAICLEAIYRFEAEIPNTH